MDAKEDVSLLNHKPLNMVQLLLWWLVNVSATGTDIIVTAGFGTLQYSADESNYQTGNVITVNAPGTYTFRLKMRMDVVLPGGTSYHCRSINLTPTVTTSPLAQRWIVIAVATTGGSGKL
jgi:hypothetical protein